MAEDKLESDISRRQFLQWSSLTAGLVALGGGAQDGFNPFITAAAEAGPQVNIINTSCVNDCGGRCVLKAHVQNGRIIRITSDLEPETPEALQLRACLKGRSYRQVVYNPDRLKYPLKRHCRVQETGRVQGQDASPPGLCRHHCRLRK